VFKSARLASEQSSFSTNLETARNYLPVTHDTFGKKWNVKAVSSKVQVTPLLRQRHNVAHGLHHKPSIGPSIEFETPALESYFMTKGKHCPIEVEIQKKVFHSFYSQSGWSISPDAIPGFLYCSHCRTIC